jgi:hypothetical protein
MLGGIVKYKKEGDFVVVKKELKRREWSLTGFS